MKFSTSIVWKILNLILDEPEMFKQVSYFFEEMSAFKEREVRKKAIESFEKIFKKLSGSKLNRNIVYSLSRLMINGHYLRKYAVACLIPVSASKLKEDGFKKVIVSLNYFSCWILLKN